MRALSVKQPWAGWIAEGTKTIEVRTWRTNYRGAIVICASREPDWAAITPKRAKGLPLGVALCTVRLEDCRPMTEADASAAHTSLMKGRWAWVLGDLLNIQRPFPVTGRLGFFDVKIPNGMTLEAK